MVGLTYLVLMSLDPSVLRRSTEISIIRSDATLMPVVSRSINARGLLSFNFTVGIINDRLVGLTLKLVLNGKDTKSKLPH